MLVILTFVTGVIYPLIITGVAHLEFPGQARGSLVGDPEQPVGSTLIGQANTDPRYFWPRPSATGYGTLPSGASNLAPTSLALAESVVVRAADFRTANGLGTADPVPVEMLFASGSGLDPHQPRRGSTASQPCRRGARTGRNSVTGVGRRPCGRPAIGLSGKPTGQCPGSEFGAGCIKIAAHV